MKKVFAIKCRMGVDSDWYVTNVGVLEEDLSETLEARKKTWRHVAISWAQTIKEIKNGKR